ncbi:MAG: M20/M25/M40 family metallo-hydrolase [Myxococcota bacterium]
MILPLLFACATLGCRLGDTPPAAPPPGAAAPTAVPPAAPPTGATTTGAAMAAIEVVEPLVEADPVVARLLAAARADEATTWQRIVALCDGFGARPTGSKALAQAIDWSMARFREDGMAAVRAEPVTVPVWERGAESLVMTAPYTEPLGMLGLGGSVGTPGVEASVVVVRSFAELGPHVAGKIVLYDAPMEEGTPSILRYGTAVSYRSQGASRAARHGAVAALVRSVTTRSLHTPHTGGMRYADGVREIPTAAITTEDADRIARLTAAGTDVRLKLAMGARRLPDAPSANVIAEIPGESDEIVLIGAHIDSWDVGTGAQDDGAGVIHVVEAMRHLRALGVTPKRTIRAVLFTNEEYGLAGAEAYDAAHGGLRYAAAIESDLGAGRPLGWSASGKAGDLGWLTDALAPTGLGIVGRGGGADIGPLEQRGVLVIGMQPDDSRYFDIHHTRADTVDKIDPAALAEGVGQMAALTWRLANLERAEPGTR